MKAETLGIPFNGIYIYLIGYHTGHDREFELIPEYGLFSSYESAAAYIDNFLNNNSFSQLKPVRFELCDREASIT